MKFKLNTKLRLENSTLGTYETVIGEDDKSYIQLPKGLKVENFIGVCFNTVNENMTGYTVVTYAMATVVDGKEMIHLKSGKDIVGEYAVSTGELKLPF